MKSEAAATGAVEADSSSPSRLTRLRATPVGALLLSWDLGVGLILGSGLGLTAALIPQLQVNGFAFMIALSGIAAGVAALVLAPMAILLSAISPEFHRLLASTDGGLTGMLLPFKQVVVIAVSACLAGLVVAVLAPLASVTLWWGVWIAASVPIILLVWAVAGCVQVTAHAVEMVKTDREAVELLERIRKAEGPSGDHVAR